MAAEKLFGVIDPRDSYLLEAFFSQEAAIDYAQWLEQSSCHTYKNQNVKLIVKELIN